MRLQRARFGFYPLFVLFGGTLGVLMAMATLVLFWGWGVAKIHGGGWTYVATIEWAARLITLCSTVIRECISAQSIVCCMILATLALEHGLVIFQDATSLSMLQYSSSGLYALIFPFFRGAKYNRRPLYSERILGLI